MFLLFCTNLLRSVGSDRIPMVSIHTTLGRRLWQLIRNASNVGRGL